MNKHYNPLLCAFIFSAFLIISIVSRSQQKSFIGYYVSITGDTISGTFPGYKQWNYNPDKVSFVAAGTSSGIQLTTLNTKQFYIDGFDTYVAYNGPRMSNPLVLGKEDGGDSGNTYDSVSTFLRQIALTTNYKFYSFKDKKRINLFYAGTDDLMVELLQKSAVIDNKFWRSDEYKFQLGELIEGTKQKDQIKRLRYSDESLAEFINSQNGGNKNVEKTNNKIDGFFIAGGISLNSLKIKGEKISDFSKADYASNISPVIGIEYYSTVGRNFGRVFLLPQLQAYSYKNQAITTYPTATTTNTFKCPLVVALRINVGYNLVNKSEFKLFISSGAGLPFLFKNKLYTETDNSLSITKQKTSLATISFSGNINAGIIASNKYKVWLTYLFPMRTSGYQLFVVNSSSVQLGLGYRL